MKHTTTVLRIIAGPGTAFSDACRCVAGYYGCSWNCRACPPGTYKLKPSYTADGSTCDEAGPDSGAHPDDVCVPCGPGRYNPAAAATTADACSLCTLPTEPDAQRSSCVCGAGEYMQTNGSGSVTCLPCPAGTYGPGAGLTSKAECIPCAVHAETPAGSAGRAACDCLPGYSGIGHVACVPCPANQRSVLGGPPGSGLPAKCEACPENATAPVASSSCTCEAGTYAAWGAVAPWDLMAGPTLWCLPCPNNSDSSPNRSIIPIYCFVANLLEYSSKCLKDRFY